MQNLTARLACIRHAASVHPEPGSNSSKKNLTLTSVEHETSEEASLTYLKHIQNALLMPEAQVALQSIDVDLHYSIFNVPFSEATYRNL